jgi:hypothetical protein
MIYGDMMTRTDNGLQYLTLEEVRQQLDVPIDQLRAFADRSEVRDYAGAIPNPKTRGVMWPLSAVPLLSHLVTMRHAGKLEPKNVKGLLEDLERADIGRTETGGALSASGLSPISTVLIGQSRRSPDALTVLPDDWITAANVFKAALGAARELTEEIAVIQRPNALPDHDVVFDAAGAAEFLCCSVRLLRANVPASFRLGSSQAGDRWYRRDLLAIKGGDR